MKTTTFSLIGCELGARGFAEALISNLEGCCLKSPAALQANIWRAVGQRATVTGQSVKNGLLILIVFAFVLGGCNSAAPPSTFLVQLNGHLFYVELANSPQSQRQGLTGRDHLAQDGGMLFVWPEPTIATMWMKGCEIPLDVLFFDHNRRLINSHSMAVVSPEQPDQNQPKYSSDKPATYALEVAGGTVVRLGIKPGTTISFGAELLKALDKGTE